MSRNFPKIHPPQVALIIAERATGIIVSVDGLRILDGKSLYQIFDTLEEAERFIKESKLDNSFEFAAYSADGALIGTIDR